MSHEEDSFNASLAINLDPAHKTHRLTLGDGRCRDHVEHDAGERRPYFGEHPTRRVLHPAHERPRYHRVLLVDQVLPDSGLRRDENFDWASTAESLPVIQ